MHTVVDSGVIHLMADYGFPIDNGAASLAEYHGAGYFNRSMLLKDCGFQIEPSSVNIAQFHASLCRQGEKMAKFTFVCVCFRIRGGGF